MKLWSCQHVFEHPWETVVTAAQRKYPNPFNTNVVGLDILDRYVDNKGALQSHRLMQTSWGLPAWVVKLVGLNRAVFVKEHSEVDPGKKTMVLKSRNVTFHNFITVDETLVYSPDPENKNKTILKQEAVVQVHGMSLGFGGQLEGIMAGKFDANAQKGREAMEWVIAKVKEEAQEVTDAAKKSFNRMEQAMHINNSSMQDSL